jgi:hypothetical protein
VKKESTMKFVKAGAAVLACTGVVISPENQESIVAGFLALYAIFSGVQGKFKKDDNK